MAFCEYCKTEGQKTGTCAYCGTQVCAVPVMLVYGPTKKEAVSVEAILTQKYLLIRPVTKSELYGGTVAAAGIGIAGAAVATAIKKKKKKLYGYYDLQDFQKVIYPYYTQKISNKTAIRFVNKDGTDFVLHFTLNGMFSAKSAKTVADCLTKVGMVVEDGSGQVSPVCCMAPFVNEHTCGTHLCASAAAFVKGADEQVIAPPQPAVAVAPPQPAVQKAKFCFACGAALVDGARFCGKCGTPIQG